MKLLVDQNLSRNLVGRLRDYFPDSAHVTTLGLETATDKDVWDHAGEHGYTIVSKDSDFRQLAFLHGPTQGHLASRGQCHHGGPCSRCSSTTTK